MTEEVNNATSVQQTSIDAYRDIQENLGSRQAQVFNLFARHPHFNYINAEVSEILCLPINQVTPRVKELRDLGLLVEATRRVNDRTGKTCIAWRVNI